MDKSPDAFRTISEVADWLDTPAHVLRFWESRFTQVKPVKRAGGRRYYRPSDMALLGGIKKLLHEDGMTIRGVQKLLREHGVKYVASLAPVIDGVEPVSAPIPADTVIPPAPMAEMVPLDDSEPVPIEEKIVPFSRPAPEQVEKPQEREAETAPIKTEPLTPEPVEEAATDAPTASAEQDDTVDDTAQTAFNFDLPPASDVPEEPIGLAFSTTPEEITPDVVVAEALPTEEAAAEETAANEIILDEIIPDVSVEEDPISAEPPFEATPAPTFGQSDDADISAEPDLATDNVEKTPEIASAPEPDTGEPEPVVAATSVPLGTEIPDDPDEEAIADLPDGLVGRLDYRMLAQLPAAEIDALLARSEALYHRLSRSA